MHSQRSLIVTADDFGIGPATSQGILHLARQGLITASVLLVNSPYAEEAVRAWQQADQPMELGWHPCLTLDGPVLPPHVVPSLVQTDGGFRSLAGLIRQCCLGRLRDAEIVAELRQWHRFTDLVGRPPTLVNSHHHVQVFSPIGRALHALLGELHPLPYLRRVREPLRTLGFVPGARGKRAFLSLLGRREARKAAEAGFSGNDWLLGVTDPPWVSDPSFLVQWLRHAPRGLVELTCHPGFHDPTLVGRDATAHDGQLERRVHELERLRDPRFREACQRLGFTLLQPAELARLRRESPRHAA